MFTTKPSAIVQRKYKSPFLYGFYYAFGYILGVWIIFLLFDHTSLLDFNYAGFLLLGIWLLAIPYYFILKKNCDPLYLLCSFFALLIISILWLRIYLRLNYFIPRNILLRIFPSYYGWEYLDLVPMIVAPFVGAIPIIIDLFIYIGKWFVGIFRNRKR